MHKHFHSTDQTFRENSCMTLRVKDFFHTCSLCPAGGFPPAETTCKERLLFANPPTNVVDCNAEGREGSEDTENLRNREGESRADIIGSGANDITDEGRVKSSLCLCHAELHEGSKSESGAVGKCFDFVHQSILL